MRFDLGTRGWSDEDYLSPISLGRTVRLFAHEIPWFFGMCRRYFPELRMDEGREASARAYAFNSLNGQAEFGFAAGFGEQGAAAEAAIRELNRHRTAERMGRRCLPEFRISLLRRYLDDWYRPVGDEEAFYAGHRRRLLERFPDAKTEIVGGMQEVVRYVTAPVEELDDSQAGRSAAHLWTCVWWSDIRQPKLLSAPSLMDMHFLVDELFERHGGRGYPYIVVMPPHRMY